mmetsp:Transcript_5501/g.9336  ORF Transcript_5501/g.9336 Transcript_5501/m.9336 type:complete len:156 (-) Transcript_5501:460-927(-)
MEAATHTNSAERVSGILHSHQSDSERRKSKPHVTWDEDQLAEHDKTRGRKMKIDEPKTPYVTDEEFKKLCEDDEDYVREFGNPNQPASKEGESQVEGLEKLQSQLGNKLIPDIDVDSQEAENDNMSEKDGCRECNIENLDNGSEGALSQGDFSNP